MTPKPKFTVIYDESRGRGNTTTMYFHCRRCLDEFQDGIDHQGEPIGPMRPADYCRLNVGVTPTGWQVWCARHEINVVAIDVEPVQ